jgi:hypothetical protein
VSERRDNRIVWYLSCQYCNYRRCISASKALTATAGASGHFSQASLTICAGQRR